MSCEAAESVEDAIHGIFADAVIKKMMQLRSLYVMIIGIE